MVWYLHLILFLGLLSGPAWFGPGPLDGRAAWAGEAAEVSKTNLTFRVMVSSFSNGLLIQAGSGQMSITVGGQTAGVYQITAGGRLGFVVPRGQTSRWTLSVPGLDDRHFRAEFSGAILNLYNEDRNDRAVAYRANTDGSYALEYYQERLYVCNQGDPGGPILGKLKTGRRVGASSAAAEAAAEQEPEAGLKEITGRLQIWAIGDYFVYAGQRGWRSPGVPSRDWWADYYANLNQHPEYTLLGRVSGDSSFAASYAYYVIATLDRFRLDAVQYTNGDYVRGLWYASNTAPNTSPAIVGPPDGRYCTFGFYDWSQFGRTYNGWVALDARTAASAPPPAGGSEDDFGGPLPGEVVAGAVTDVRDLPPTEQVSAEWNQARRAGQPLSDNRVAGFSLSSGTATTGLIDPQTVQMPGLVFQWVYAGTRATQQWLLPLGRSGTLPNGITWQTLTGTLRNGSRALVFLRQFAASYLAGLASGRHTLNYWLQDSAGRRSNVRTETITIQ